jgi:hypothetical protein
VSSQPDHSGCYAARSAPVGIEPPEFRQTLHGIAAEQNVDVYGTLPPQPSVAPHTLGTGPRRLGKFDHRFCFLSVISGSRFFSLT